MVTSALHRGQHKGSSFSPWPISSSLFSLTWKGSFLYLLFNDKVGLSYSVELRMKKNHALNQLKNRDFTDLYRSNRGTCLELQMHHFELLKMLGQLKIVCQQNWFRHRQTNSQMRIILEPLSSFSISKGRYQVLCTQLNKPTTNQSNKTWPTSNQSNVTT